MPAASYWWKTGHAAYYAAADQDGDSIRFGAVTSEAAKATRDHLERKADPRLSKLLEGEEVKEFSPAVAALCWTWVSFLEHADGGAHHAYLERYYKAITEGDKSGREAGAEVFPVEKFNELFPRFEIYLEGL